MAQLPPFVPMVGRPRADYRLLDSGQGRKLEDYSGVRLIRPEPQAIWEPVGGDWHADGECLPAAD